MRRQWLLFLTALQFLTRLPVPPLSGFQPEWAARSARYFPLAGLMVGVIAGGGYWAGRGVWSPGLAALLSLAAAATVTGALHEDGLADCADGLWGGANPSRRLEIMKDSRVGTYGALALILSVGLRGLALATLSGAIGFWALIAAAMGGRACATVIMHRLDYAGDPKAVKAPGMLIKVTAGESAAAALLGLVGAAPLVSRQPFSATLALICGCAAVFGFVVLMRRRIGGWTGDGLGAAVQLFETACLVVLAARGAACG